MKNAYVEVERNIKSAMEANDIVDSIGNIV